MAPTLKKQKANLAKLHVSDAAAVMAHFQDDDDGQEVVQAEGMRAWASLDNLRKECIDSVEFHQALREDVGFDDTGVAVIQQTLDHTSRFQVQGMKPVAAVPISDLTTERLVQAHGAWMHSEDCRRELRKAFPACRQVDNPDHEFAPFVHWLKSRETLPSVKAEALARFDQYIRSGWAADDLAPGNTPDKNESEAVLRLREIAERLRNGQPVDDLAVCQALERRFAQLFKPFQVIKRSCAQGLIPVAEALDQSKFSLFSENGGSTEGCGIIDAVIRDRDDPTAWHMALATSNEETTHQNDQLFRHTTALLNSMQMGLKPFGAGGHLASLAFYSPACMTEANRQRIGGNHPLSDEECEALHALALYNQLGHGHINTQQVSVLPVLWAQHQGIGGASAAQGRIGGDPAALAKNAAKVVARAINAMAMPERDYDLEHRGSRCALRLFDQLALSTTGLCTHFPAAAKAELMASVPQLRNLSVRAERAGLDGYAARFEMAAGAIETINETTLTRKPRQRRLPTDDDVEPMIRRQQRRERRKTDLGAVLETMNQQGKPLSATFLNRLSDTACRASDAVWTAVLQGMVSVHTTSKAVAGNGKMLLGQPDCEQDAWLKNVSASPAEAKVKTESISPPAAPKTGRARKSQTP